MMCLREDQTMPHLRLVIDNAAPVPRPDYRTTPDEDARRAALAQEVLRLAGMAHDGPA